MFALPLIGVAGWKAVQKIPKTVASALIAQPGDVDGANGGAALVATCQSPHLKLMARVPASSRTSTPSMLFGGGGSKAKTAAKKPVKKTIAKKPVKKAPVKKAPVKKAPVKKAPVKKAPVKKAVARKPVAKKGSKPLSKPSAKTGAFCYGLPGSLPPVGEFDPLNLLEGKSYEQVLRWREVELTHCRVGMLASLGFLVQESFHPLFGNKGGTAAELFSLYDEDGNVMEVFGLAWPLYVTVFFIVGGLEGWRLSKIGGGFDGPYSGDYYPGDLGFDPLGLKPDDPAELVALQTKELQNGRLAMIAAAGFCAQEAVSGATWSTVYA
jgi:hypothetical protein